MRAVVCTKYGSPDVLQLKDISKPKPKKNEVCIRIRATSVTASDCIIRGFKVPFKIWLPMGLVIGFRKPRKSVLGMVFAGEIESIGQSVKKFKIGDQVFGFDRFGFGTYADFKCISEDGLILEKPSSISFQDAASVPFGGLLAMHYLKKGNVMKNQNILIYGASGAVGTSAVQIAKVLGATVTGVCSTGNLELVKGLGADFVIDYTKEDFTKSETRFDLKFNAVGNKKVKLNCEKSLTKTGKLICVDDGTPKFQTTDLDLLSKYMKKGQIKAVIDRVYPLEDIIEAHRYVDGGHKKGNVIINL